MSTGRDVGLLIGSSSVTFNGPSDYQAVFTGSSPFSSPAGIDATFGEERGRHSIYDRFVDTLDEYTCYDCTEG